MTKETLLLSRKEVANCITIPDIIEVVEETLMEHAKGNVMFPPRGVLPTRENREAWPGYNSNLSARPAYLKSRDVAGVRWVGAFWDNRIGIPPQIDLVILTDPLNGITLAIMEATFPLALRVAAQGVVGAKHLAKDKIETIGIFGAGLQGRCHLVTFDKFYNIKKAKVFDINEAASKKFLEEMAGKVKADIVLCKTIEETSKGSDIVVTVTTAKEPFLRLRDFSRGVLILAQGGVTEVAKDVIVNAGKIIVSSLSQAKEAGGLAGFFQNGDIKDENIYCELKDLVSKKKAGRERDDENIVLSTTGLPTLDIAIADKVYKKALEKGIGTFINFGVDLDVSSFF